MLAAKEKGLVRQEGKEYVVQDGDVILFKGSRGMRMEKALSLFLKEEES